MSGCIAGGSTMKLSSAVAALVLLAASSFTHVMAYDASSPSVASCAYGEPSDGSTLAPEVVALRRAVFMKLCEQLNGALVNGGDSHSGHLKQPGKIIGPNIGTFYPPESVRHNETGTVVIAFVVETDGRISRAALLKSSGYPALDKAALAWLSQVRYETPAYLDSTPVRVYLVTNVDFHVI
jgi:TonB family protein